MASRTIQEICRRFNLGVPRSAEGVRGTRTKSIVIRTDRGQWFLRRRYEDYADPERLAFDHAAMYHLAGRRIPVPVPRCDAEGKSWWTSGDSVWEVYPFASGHPMEEATGGLIDSLGSELGRFHRAGETFPHRLEKLGPRGETDPDRLLEVIEAHSKTHPQGTAILDRYRQWVSTAAGQLTGESYRKLPHTLIHGDVQPGNVLFHENRLSAWIDLDWCAWRPRLYDLAFAVLFCCSTHETPIRGDDIRSLTQPFRLEPTRVGLFLDTVQATGGELTTEERKAFLPQTVLSWCHSRLAGSLKVPEEERLSFLEREPLDLLKSLEPLSRVL